jgi:hypothetical protein
MFFTCRRSSKSPVYIFVCQDFKISRFGAYWHESITGREPIIANLHVIRERTRIFGPFFADDNNKWWQSRQQNPTFVSWIIQKKSGKTPLETKLLYINLTELGCHLAEMPVAIINKKIYQIGVLEIAKSLKP